MQSSSVAARQTNIPLFQRNRSGPASTYCFAVSRSGFSRNCRSRRAVAVERRFAKFQVAVAGGRAGRRNAEGHQRLGMLLDQRIARADDRLEPIDRLDDVVGGEDADDRLGIAPGEHGGAEPDGVERVAPARLAEELVRAKLRQRPANRLGVRLSGADEAPLGRQQPFEPLERRFPAGFARRSSGINCFGSAARLIGQSRVPDPPAMIMAYRMSRVYSAIVVVTTLAVAHRLSVCHFHYHSPLPTVHFRPAAPGDRANRARPARGRLRRSAHRSCIDRQHLGRLGAGVVMDAFVAHRAVEIVGAVGQGRLRRAHAQRNPIRLDMVEVVEHQPADGHHAQVLQRRKPGCRCDKAVFSG